jgi:glutamate--cysteine ligase
MRPKQIAKSGEKPTLALKHRGVEYIEMRSLDLDLFNPIGIDESKSRFIEAFLLNCLLQESPKHKGQEDYINNINQLDVAHRGRKPGLELNKNGQQVLLNDWASEIVKSMQPVCEILDEGKADKLYSKAVEQQLAVVQDAELTPSAKILKGMRDNKQPFGRFGLNTSEQYKQYFEQQKLDKITTHQFDEMSVSSRKKQQEIEAGDSVSFDEFLANYFSQQ